MEAGVRRTGPWKSRTAGDDPSWVAATWRAVSRWRDVWNATGTRTQLAVVLAALFAVAGMISLVSAVGRTTAQSRAVAPTPAAVASLPPLRTEAAPADAGRTWSLVQVWQGSGTAETEPFSVREHWRVDWIHAPTETGGPLQVFIYHADGRVLMSLAANTTKGGADTTFWVGPGRYFLKVNSTGDWKVAVQDLR